MSVFFFIASLERKNKQTTIWLNYALYPTLLQMNCHSGFQIQNQKPGEINQFCKSKVKNTRSVNQEVENPCLWPTIYSCLLHLQRAESMLLSSKVVFFYWGRGGGECSDWSRLVCKCKILLAYFEASLN